MMVTMRITHADALGLTLDCHCEEPPHCYCEGQRPEAISGQVRNKLHNLRECQSVLGGKAHLKSKMRRNIRYAR
jgi:hypothetical protein